MYFPKQLLLLFLVNQEKLLAVSGKCLKILNKFTFNIGTFQVLCQGFYIDFRLLLLLCFRFPIACTFQNNSFSLPLHGCWPRYHTTTD